MIEIGLTGLAETVVSDQNSAQAAGSGTLPVFGTPFMVALMEQAALSSIAPFLTEEQSSVGTAIAVSHVSATPLGMAVRAESEVTEIQGKMIHFRVAAYDACGLIGEGTHTRAIITAERFLDKTNNKGN